MTDYQHLKKLIYLKILIYFTLFHIEKDSVFLPKYRENLSLRYLNIFIFNRPFFLFDKNKVMLNISVVKPTCFCHKTP